MPSFFRMVWAVIFGVLLLDAAVLGIVWVKWGQGPEIEKQSILQQSISGSVIEYPVGGHTSGIFASGGPTLHGILGNLEKAARDDRVDGVLLVLSHVGAGYGMLEEIRSGIRKVRDAGKPVWAWSDDFVFRDLYLASACDSFFVHPTGYVYLGGMYLERPYVAGMLEKLGITPEVHRIARYKSAAELVTRREMSPEAREMVGWIEDDIYPRVLEETAEGLGIDTAILVGAMERALPMVDELEAMGVVSGLRYWDEMKAALPRPEGKDEPRMLSASVYGDVDPADVGIKGKKKIAVVHAQGLIGGSKSGRDPIFGITMGHASVNSDLKKALDDEDVVGVVFRVDSGGGESITGDRIGRMVEVVDREKPVVVSMVDVAASAGYSISYRARLLMADANSITGSIGSITGKFDLSGLHEKLGIHLDGEGRGPNADFYSNSRRWTEEEYAMVSAEHWEGYRRWIAHIAEFREMTPAEIDSLGRGRVWTGAQAVENGLIDELGGLDLAVTRAKEAAGLDAGEEVTLVHLPRPEGFVSQLLGMDLSAAPGTLVGRWVDAEVERVDAMSRARWNVMEVPVP